jgi:hypothetical protein
MNANFQMGLLHFVHPLVSAVAIRTIAGCGLTRNLAFVRVATSQKN